MVQQIRILCYRAVGDQIDRRFSLLWTITFPRHTRQLHDLFVHDVGVGIILLQAYNVALLGAFWPFFTGIALHLVSAVLQFARMIVLSPEIRR